MQKWSVLFPVRVQMRIWIRALCSVALMLSHTISSHMLNFLSLHIYLVGICRITYSLFCLCVLYRSFTIFPCSIHFIYYLCTSSCRCFFLFSLYLSVTTATAAVAWPKLFQLTKSVQNSNKTNSHFIVGPWLDVLLFVFCVWVGAAVAVYVCTTEKYQQTDPKSSK